MNIRKATSTDLKAVAAIYSLIHQEEERGDVTIGWDAKIYPTEQTAADALRRGDLFVAEEAEADGSKRILASAIINKTQVPEYADGHWLYPAGDGEVMVLHTLTVDPTGSHHGVGKAFVSFYEDYARREGCTVLRLDTNARNAIARRMYPHLGYREAGIVPCTFNGIPNVQLVLFEKKIPSLWEQMLSGKPYDASAELFQQKLAATRDVIYELNNLRPSDDGRKYAILRSLFGSMGNNVTINQPFRCDYGCNISIGNDVEINFNLTVLDEALVSIGNNVFIGPNVGIYTACHSTDPRERNARVEWAEPVTIGDSVWIGGGATICPGVTIGEGSTIGAGSVVVKDIPPHSIAVGNPCRVIKKAEQ